MKIDKIKINGFGKIKDTEIELKDGINVIYGENESGKSTIVKFISAMLYGASKNKDGKTISDFDQYKPWDDSEFSGKIKYTLDNGEEYEVFRKFKKKNPVIYKSNQDISKEFDMDKSKGINFLEQQVGIDKSSFHNTAIISQQEVKLEKADTNIIIQKISNMVSSGDDTISYKKSIDQITKLQNENVGSERTKNKPINIVDSNIKKLSEEKNNLKLHTENYNYQAEQKEKIATKINELQDKKDKLKIEKQASSDNEIKNIKTEFKMKIYIFILLLLVVVSVALFVALKNKVMAVIPVILLIIDIVLVIKTKSKVNLGKSNYDTRKIEKDLEELETQINDLKLKSHILEKEKANLDEKLEKLLRVEEELEKQKEIKEELLSLDTSYALAKECLMKAYDEIKHNLSPKFEQKLCEITSNITDGKYNNITVNDEHGLYIEAQNGSYVPVNQLSVGTIDEMYLSLRLSMLSEISKEHLPILLDETFAYFDDMRLKNILCYLQDKNYDYQIIIFSCTNREEVALNQLKIEYNLIKLEK